MIGGQNLADKRLFRLMEYKNSLKNILGEKN